MLFKIGTSYVSAIIFSWISDAKLGRAKTILLGKRIVFIYSIQLFLKYDI
jgi:dipeptide/tripeptide permease